MSNGHFIEKCKVCGVTITQCRCMDPNKEVRYSICGACQKKQIAPPVITTECTLTGAPQTADSVKYETALTVLKEYYHDLGTLKISLVTSFTDYCQQHLIGRTGK